MHLLSLKIPILKYLSVLLSLIFLLISCQNTQSPSNASTSIDLDPEIELEVAALQAVNVYYDDQLSSGFSLRTLQNELSTQAYNEVDGAKLNAQAVANLIGGVRGFRGDLKPISKYKAGDALKVARSFYIGSTYDHPIPQAFKDDIIKGAPVTWISYNIWQFGSDLAKLGLEYQSLVTAYTVVKAAESFNTISYNGYDFKKDIKPMDMVKLATLPGTEVLATAKKPSGETIPYAVKNGAFWYIADLPTSYIHVRDRYLVFADLVPKMLGIYASCDPSAIIRVEDVKPSDPVSDLTRTFDALADLNIPYGIATVPLWRNEGKNITKTWNDNPEGLATLLKAASQKGEVLQHGYTHTYDGLLNPSGLSGNDWEFWNINTNRPIAELSEAKAANRVSQGKAVLESLGLKPIGWVTPHYAANPTYYPEFKKIYFRQFERKMLMSGDIFGGQFFPYPVRDINNRTLVLPENADFISKNNSLDNILETAKANKALSCPWLGLFVHPYLMDPSFTGEGSMTVAEFKAFIKDIEALGYSFQKLSTVELNPISQETSPDKPFTSAMVVQHTKMCADAYSSPLFQWNCQGWLNQTFDFSPVTGKTATYTIKAKAHNECLAVKEGKLDKGVNIIREACNNQNYQQFELKAVGNNFLLQAVHSGKCVGIQADALWGGADLRQQVCDQGLSQQWQLPGY